MAIRRSRSADIAQLISQLTSEAPVERESAAARLAIIGSRAARALAALAGRADAAPEARAAALRALDTTSSSRAAALAAALLHDIATIEPRDEPLAVEAIQVLSRNSQGRSASAEAAFERLTEIALAAGAPAALRVAALRALKEHPAEIVAPVITALGGDSDARVAAETGQPGLDTLVTEGRTTEAAALLGARGATVPITVLRRAVDAARQHERADPARAVTWQHLRAELHQALGRQHSRLALYDLKETLEGASAPLPIGFLSAAAAVGDRSCLEPLARAWLAAGAEGDAWWRGQVVQTFAAVAAREGLTRQHATLKKIVARWPASADLIASAIAPPVSRPSRTRR
jgi:hypothetical protein